jgi:hypothetical protein
MFSFLKRNVKAPVSRELPPPRTISKEIVEQLTDAGAPASPDPSDRREAVRVCVGTRAKIRVGRRDAPLVAGMVRDLSSKSVGLLMEFAPRLNELCWIYIPKRMDPTEHIAVTATINRCVRGGVDQSVFLVAAMFVEGEAPELPRAAEPVKTAAAVMPRSNFKSSLFSHEQPISSSEPKA